MYIYVYIYISPLSKTYPVDFACFEVKALVPERLIVIEDFFSLIELLLLKLNYSFRAKTNPILFDQSLL